MLHAQGICPSVPRVTSRLQSGSLREWKVVCKAVNDARQELLTDEAMTAVSDLDCISAQLAEE
jgi:hypothetical protein